MKSQLFSLIITMTLALPVGGWCKSGLQHKVIYEKRRDHVFLMYESDENNNIVVQNFEHPAALTTEQVSRIFGKLRYSKSVFFKWRGNYDVFFESELDDLSGLISRALQEASPNEWVRFASTVQSRDPIDSVPLLTDGYVFKKGGKLHVVLLNLKSEFTKENRPKSGDPREIYSLGFKRINLAGPISAPSVIPGMQFLEKPHHNWAIIDIDSLLNPKIKTDVAEEEPPKAERKNLIDRMKILKELFDSELITEEEYKKKKEDILNEL